MERLRRKPLEEDDWLKTAASRDAIAATAANAARAAVAAAAVARANAAHSAQSPSQRRRSPPAAAAAAVPENDYVEYYSPDMYRRHSTAGLRLEQVGFICALSI